MWHPTNETRVRRQGNHRVALNTVGGGGGGGGGI